MAHNSPDIPEPTIKTSVLSLVNIYYKVPYQPYTRNMIIKEDEEIILECLSGNTDSYKYLVEKYQFRIINTCYKYTKNIVDAEDVAQEVFLKAYQNLSTFKSNSKFYSWLYELINKLQPLMDNLPDDLRILIELYEIKDFTYDEISKKLSIPIGTVRSRLHRARNMLISDFKRINDEE